MQPMNIGEPSVEMTIYGRLLIQEHFLNIYLLALTY